MFLLVVEFSLKNHHCVKVKLFLLQFQGISKVYDSKSEDYESSAESEAGESEFFGDERHGNCFSYFQVGMFLS